MTDDLLGRRDLRVNRLEKARDLGGPVAERKECAEGLRLRADRPGRHRLTGDRKAVAEAAHLVARLDHEAFRRLASDARNARQRRDVLLLDAALEFLDARA